MIRFPRTVVALDWTGETAKLLKVRIAGSRSQILDYAVSVPGQVRDIGPLVRDFAGRFRKQLHVAYPGRQTQIRQIDLPLASESDLASSLPFEIRRHVPFAGTEDWGVYYQILGKDREKGRLSILAAVADRAERGRSVELLASGGLEPRRMELPPLAAVNHLIHAKERDTDDCWGVLDVGASGSWLVLKRRGAPLHVRSLSVGCASFAQEIVLRCGVNRHEADLVQRAEISLSKVKPEWRDRTATLPSLLRNTLDELAVETMQQINQFRMRQGPVRRLHLGGGGALVHGIATVLQNKIAIPVLPAHPFQTFSIPGTWDDKKRDHFEAVSP
ncbi:MAG: pilus assembly protein PilM, partial [Gemmatimonadetes bacterium]|nr:pilus assembly protein PilM [Gemmatimonadota bacterium]